MKLPCSDFREDGFTFSECCQVCQWMDQWGIDAVEITGNNYTQCSSLAGKVLDGHAIQKDGYFAEFAKALPQTEHIHVFVTGGFRTLESIENLLTSGKITGVGIARPFFTEPDLVAQWKK